MNNNKYLCFLSTVDEEGKPHLRPVTCIVCSGHIYFSTKDGSRKAKEISMNPAVEVLFPDIEEGKLGYIRVSGESFRIFENSVREDILQKFDHNLADYLHIKERDIILMYEILPNAVERFDPKEKTKTDVSQEFLQSESEKPGFNDSEDE